LLAELVPPLAGVDLAEPERPVNRSATDTALEVLQRRYRAGETLKRPEWRKVLNEHASARQSTGFAAFPEAVRATLDDVYQADLDRLERLDGITFLRRRAPLP
jgi:hypothetical protein